jgi:hypothetical protein
MKLSSFAAKRLCPLGMLCAIALPALPALAGPLTPPAGAVAPTHKTLTEVEPRVAISATNTPGDASNEFRITQPGSYYLTGNLVTGGSRNGIQIAADNVTIDLNGFTLSQDPAGTGFPAGIRASAPVRNFVLKNGTVRAYRGYGATGNFENSTFHDLAFTDSLGGQLEIGASDGVIVRNVRTRATTGETGIQVGPGSLVESCATEGGTIGITVGVGSVVRSCVVVTPGSTGIFASGSLVIDCTVSGGTSASSLANAGISMPNGGRIERCLIRSTVAPGVVAGARAEVMHTTFLSCSKGVVASTTGGGRVTVTGCTFVQSTVAGVVLTGPGSLVISNRFSGNAVNIDTSGSSGVGANGGNAVGEVIDVTGGATVGASASSSANIVY